MSDIAAGRRTLGPSIVVVLAIGGVLAVAVALDFRVKGSIEEGRSLVAQAGAQAAATRDVLEALRDAETGQRGFLLTGKPSYLQPYWDGQARIGPALERLRDLTARSPRLAEDARALRGLAEQKMAELDSTLVAERDHGHAAALAIVQNDFGKATMDAARERTGMLLRDLDAEHADLAIRVREREGLSSEGTVLTAALGAIVLGAATLALLRGRARLLEAQAALREQSTRLTGTIQNMRDGVAVFDARHRLRLWNPLFAGLSALQTDKLRIGATIDEILEAAWPGLMGGDVAPGGRPVVREVRHGRDVLEIWRGAMPDGGQIVMAADITRRTEAEAIARQAKKMESLGQLTGGVAHDFNNLLQVVSANLELLGSRIEKDSWLAARLQGALAAVERASRLTRQLLAFARRQPLTPESIDTRRLLLGLEDMLRRTLGERVSVEIVAGGGLWATRADPQQLENAILNLAINARDAMPGGGKLTIEAVNAMLDDDYAAREAEVSAGAYVLVAVSDTGVGMDAEQLVRAMEPFYTTKTDGRGSGLGLPMVFGFAKQSHGHFKLYSEPGHGTTARLYIPRSTTEPVPVATPPEAAQAGEGELVLLVEDDDIVRAAATQAVRGLGYRVIEAASAAAALQILRAGERPDLLFTDVVMPGKPDARTMAEQARQMLPRLAVLFTSGYTENTVVHHGHVDPGVRLISKPWRIADLARRLRQALDDVRPPETRPVRRLRVLLAEDEMLIRMTTADMLTELGHEPREASSAREALAALERDPGIDLLVTDLGLPDLDGLELARRAVAGRPGLPVIVASGRAAAETSQFTFLAKPFDRASLGRAIAEATQA